MAITAMALAAVANKVTQVIQSSSKLIADSRIREWRNLGSHLADKKSLSGV